MSKNHNGINRYPKRYLISEHDILRERARRDHEHFQGQLARAERMAREDFVSDGPEVMSFDEATEIEAVAA
jgi:hypothetical protein